MLIATIYALVAAVLHAGWNLAAKKAFDPFLTLWGQFIVAGAGSAVVLGIIGSPPVGAWGWAALSGLIHVPYILGLAWAYRHGDFSLAYPVARGGGALVAAIGGLLLLDDELSVLAIVAILLIFAGMSLLALGAPATQVMIAIGVAVAIGSYTVVDSHAAREYGGVSYVFAAFVTIGVCITVAGVAGGRSRDLFAMGRDMWARAALAATMSVITYGLVLLAVQRAPVGYVTALRESSVLIASVVGWRMLHEGRGRARTMAGGVIVAGLVLLVSS
ncbi:MAG: EamA family transporter [Actinomycetia bacterium]|nr:EamA family transporter [Actinomycetes bacterium]MCP5034389.1 EamA family transporter [Actinomycetes bacterium]